MGIAQFSCLLHELIAKLVMVGHFTQLTALFDHYITCLQELLGPESVIYKNAPREEFQGRSQSIEL